MYGPGALCKLLTMVGNGLHACIWLACGQLPKHTRSLDEIRTLAHKTVAFGSGKFRHGVVIETRLESISSAFLRNRRCHQKLLAVSTCAPGARYRSSSAAGLIAATGTARD